MMRMCIVCIWCGACDLYVHMYDVYAYVHEHVNAWKGQRSALDPLELEFQAV